MVLANLIQKTKNNYSTLFCENKK